MGTQWVGREWAWQFGCDLSYPHDLFSSGADPQNNSTGKASEVRGRGLRKMKTVLASEWTPSPGQGPPRPLLWLVLAASATQRCCSQNQPQELPPEVPPGGRKPGRRGLGPTTGPATWLRNRPYPPGPAATPSGLRPRGRAVPARRLTDMSSGFPLATSTTLRAGSACTLARVMN